MEKRTGIRVPICLLIAFCILPSTSLQKVSGNPIPADLEYEGRSGGSPIPYDHRDGVHFSEERVFADIGRTSAMVRAEYTFANDGAEQVTLGVLLPFLNEFKDLDIVSGGNDIVHSIDYIEYHYIDYRDFGYDPHIDEDAGTVLLNCVEFEVQIPSNSSTTVSVDYSTSVSVYDSTLNSFEIRWFSYLVGSARTWNHTIDRAYFEFRMKRALFDRFFNDHNPGWEVDKDWDEYIFTREYIDWEPEEDLMEIAWETDRTSLLFASPLFWAIVAASAVIVLAGVIVIVVWMRRRRAKKKSRKGRSS